MVLKITKKDVKNNYYYIVKCGYCELQTLLDERFCRKIGYACGIYGWNFNVYEVEASSGEKICICTGYRDMIGERIAGVGDFEKKARILRDSDIIWTDYNKYCQKHKKLIKSFADYCINELKKGGII